jgi:hypothetical protein
MINHPLELPSFEAIEAMDNQCKKVIESLEISDGSVKCQKCSLDVPMVGKLDKPHAANRITVLEHRSDMLKDIKIILLIILMLASSLKKSLQIC